MIISAADGATRHASDTDAGRLEVLLRDALLNPVLHLVVLDDLLSKTLQNLSWEKTLKINRRPPSRRPHLPKNPLWGSWPPALRECNVERSIFCTAPELRGAWVALSEATLGGRCPQGNPEGHPSSDQSRCPAEPRWA